MERRAVGWVILLAMGMPTTCMLATCMLTTSLVLADARQDACKRAMNDRIQACTDDCTARALHAASDYRDTNNNVKFGCLKGCAVGQVLTMRACVSGEAAPAGDPTETNR